MELKGYIRNDGRVGFRNYVLIVPLTNCVADITRRVSDRVPGTIPLVHAHGCDLIYRDADLFGRILEMTVTHPNVGGVVFITLSCAQGNMFKLHKKVRDSGRLCETTNVHSTGGTSSCVSEAARITAGFVDELRKQKRRTVPLSSIVLGTECGSSDATSALYTNPVVGAACDRLIDLGGTVVLSEDYELYGGKELLYARAENKDVEFRIKRMMDGLAEKWAERFNEDLEMVNNSEAIREKAVGRISKAGTKKIQAVFEMEDIIDVPGLVLLNAPNDDIRNVTCLSASGCQIIIFTTGKGTCVGSPTGICIKVTSSEVMMTENIDIDLSGLYSRQCSLKEAAEVVFEHIIQAANGQLQKSEQLGHFDFGIPIRGITF